MVNPEILLSLAENLFSAEKVDYSLWHRRITFKRCTLKQDAGQLPCGTFVEKIIILLEEDLWKARLLHKDVVIELGFKGIWCHLD